MQTVRGLALIDAARPKDGEKVCDVGCGDGRTTWSLFCSNKNIKSLLGIDISKDQINATKKLFRNNLSGNKEQSEKVNFICGDFLNKSLLENEKFGLIWLFCIMCE